MPFGRSLLLALLVGAAANPQAALPPQPLRLPAAIGVPMKYRTRADMLRDLSAKLPGSGKLARKAKRRAILAGYKAAIAKARR